MAKNQNDCEQNWRNHATCLFVSPGFNFERFLSLDPRVLVDAEGLISLSIYRLPTVLLILVAGLVSSFPALDEECLQVNFCQ